MIKLCCWCPSRTSQEVKELVQKLQHTMQDFLNSGVAKELGVWAMFVYIILKYLPLMVHSKLMMVDNGHFVGFAMIEQPLANE